MSHQHKTNFVLKIIFLHTSTFSLGITKIKFSCLLENKVLSVFCKSNSIYTKNTLRNKPIITLIFEVLLSSTSILSNSTHFHCYVFINIYELFNMSSSKINHVLEFLKSYMKHCGRSQITKTCSKIWLKRYLIKMTIINLKSNKTKKHYREILNIIFIFYQY